jgi:hypothetical protein
MRNQLTGADRAKDFGQVQQDNRSAAADKGLRTNDPITDQMKFLEGQNGKSASWTMDGDPQQPPLASITDGKSDADRAAAAAAARKEADEARKTFLRTAGAVRAARGTSKEKEAEKTNILAAKIYVNRERAAEAAEKAVVDQSTKQTPVPDALANPGLGKAPTQDQVRQQRDHLIGQPGNDNNPKPPADMRNVQVFPGSVKVGQQTNPGPEGDNGNGSSSAGGSLDRGPRPGVVDPPKSDSPGTRNPQQ